VEQRVGEAINDEYRASLDTSELSADQVGQVVADLLVKPVDHEVLRKLLLSSSPD